MSTFRDPRQMRLARRISDLQSIVQPALGSERCSITLQSMLELAESSVPALERTTFEPGHFTASAFVLSPDQKHLLLIRHRKLKMWLQPGGHIEPSDESLADAARREVREETGLHRFELREEIFDCDIHTIPGWASTPPHLHFDVRVLLLANSIDVIGGDDAEEARWFSLATLAQGERLETGEIGTDESVRRVARRLVGVSERAR